MYHRRIAAAVQCAAIAVSADAGSVVCAFHHAGGQYDVLQHSLVATEVAEKAGMCSGALGDIDAQDLESVAVEDSGERLLLRADGCPLLVHQIQVCFLTVVSGHGSAKCVDELHLGITAYGSVSILRRPEIQVSVLIQIQFYAGDVLPAYQVGPAVIGQFDAPDCLAGTVESDGPGPVGVGPLAGIVSIVYDVSDSTAVAYDRISVKPVRHYRIDLYGLKIHGHLQDVFPSALEDCVGVQFVRDAGAASEGDVQKCRTGGHCLRNDDDIIVSYTAIKEVRREVSPYGYGRRTASRGHSKGIGAHVLFQSDVGLHPGTAHCHFRDILLHDAVLGHDGYLQLGQLVIELERHCILCLGYIPGSGIKEI